MFKYLEINFICYITLCGLKGRIFLVVCNFRSKNELYNYMVYGLVVFLQSQNSFPEAFRVLVHIYIFFFSPGDGLRGPSWFYCRPAFPVLIVRIVRNYGVRVWHCRSQVTYFLQYSSIVYFRTTKQFLIKSKKTIRFWSSLLLLFLL